MRARRTSDVKRVHRLGEAGGGRPPAPGLMQRRVSPSARRGGACCKRDWPGQSSPLPLRGRDLPEAIKAVIEAVKQGEVDIQIEDVGEKGTAELRYKSQAKPMRKAG